MTTKTPTPGTIALFGSGETSPAGRKVFEQLLKKLPMAPKIALLETPAGFEQNSSRVVGRIAEFLQLRLQNYQPLTTVVPARRRDSAFSPDDPEILAPLLDADLIFLGPGSPTYAVRQLCDSLAWQMLVARHRLGASLALASAAVIAIGAKALPVYEIYKVGEDLHWKSGLDLFAPYGLQLVFIPHWNNRDGGDELDTSRCFMGQERFAQLMDLLPEEHTVLGIDEKTALLMEFGAGQCRVVGQGGVSVMHIGHQHRNRVSLPPSEADFDQIAHQRQGHVHRYESGETFAFQTLGSFRAPAPEAGLPLEVWQQVSAAPEPDLSPVIPAEVQALADARQTARSQKDWAKADEYRRKLAAMGWQVLDTPDGPRLEKQS